MDHILRVKEIIKQIPYITIATSSLSGKPWNTPVAASHDTSYNFYWASYRENQHSKNIRENNQVFIVIYDSTAPEGTGEGVYIQATAAELNTDEEIMGAIKTFRNDPLNPLDTTEYQGKNPRRIYKASPEKLWINGDGDIDGRYIDVRFEIPLKDVISS